MMNHQTFSGALLVLPGFNTSTCQEMGTAIYFFIRTCFILTASQKVACFCVCAQFCGFMRKSIKFKIPKLIKDYDTAHVCLETARVLTDPDLLIA